MRRSSWGTALVALAAALVGAGCGRAADRVVDEFHAMVSMGRLAEAGDLLTPDAVIVFEGTTYQGRAGARRWLDQARRRRLGFAIARTGGKRMGWKVEGARVTGTRLVQGAGFRADAGIEPPVMQIEAVVRDGRIARIAYDLTAASKAAINTRQTAQARQVAAVFDGPPPVYNLGLFGPNSVLEVGTTRVTGAAAIAGWTLGNRPASTPGELEIQGNVVRWHGTFTTGSQRQPGVAWPPARFELEFEAAPPTGARIRRYAVIFAQPPSPPAAGTSQPAPAASQPAPGASQPAGAASQPASGPQPPR